MKILVLSGSPKGEKSNTLQLTKAFLEGVSERGIHSVDFEIVAKKDIRPCLGCFSCWTKTPGECVIQDDMQDLFQKYLAADCVVWSFPLYFFSMPSQIKAVMDRLLPMMLPYIKQREDGTCAHPMRYSLEHQKHVLISTCGFYSQKNNYEGLLEKFRILYQDHGGFEKIICAEGELFRVPALRNRVESYLLTVKQAGREYAEDFTIRKQTRQQLQELLFPADEFCKMADASWKIEKISNRQAAESDAKRLVTQMSAVYQKKYYKKDSVLEFYFTDVKETYQLEILKDCCKVMADCSKNYTTRIETSLKLWQEISDGKISATDALYEKRYQVKGRFSLLYSLDSMFGLDRLPLIKKERRIAPNLLCFLLPFLAMWIAFPFGSFVGIAVSLAAVLAAVVLRIFVQSTVYETWSLAGTLAVVLLAVFNVPLSYLIPLPYFLFSALWLVSVFFKIPFTALYMTGFYGGEKALTNKLYLRTNRILTTVWAAFYLLAGVASCFASFFPFFAYWGAVANAPVLLLVAFTVLFARRYVSRYAR